MKKNKKGLLSLRQAKETDIPSLSVNHEPYMM